MQIFVEDSNMAKKIEVIMATFFIATCISFCFAKSANDLPDETPHPPRPPAPLPTPKVAKRLNKVATLLGTVNVAMGSFSRSKTVKTVSQSMRGDNDAELQEGLDQAITTLAVLDVGGGIVSPVVAHLVVSIATVKALSKTKKALENFGNKLPQFADELDDLSDGVIKTKLNQMKQVVLDTFKTDVRQIRKNDPSTLKYIKKAKRLLKVKTLAGVLGPIFDIAAVGVNSWALHTTIRDCRKDPTMCNYGAIASASLSIAAGFVGLGTFVAVFKMTAAAAAVAGPAGAIFAALLGITATCIELWYTPPSVRIASENRLKEDAMKELDTYAKEELYNATKKYTKNDLYVVNQGHLPKWFTYDPPKNSVQFGLDRNESRSYSPLDHECSRPQWRAAEVHTQTFTPSKQTVCPYLVDGNEFKSTKDDSSRPSYLPDGLGYDFYGLAKDYQEYKGNKGRPDNESPYNGATVLVSTNKVQPAELENRELSANLRGLNINTGRKGGNEPFDDQVVIGDMPTLDAGEKVIVRTGSGNDALNIDGRLGSFTSADVLDADLGEEGQNTLNFGAIASGYGIEGISFDAKTGVVQYKYGSGQQQNVGKVMHVQILEASSFDDEITLHSNRPGPDGFTVFKFKGLATYTIDISSLTNKNDTRYFTIIDSSSSLDSDEGRVPVLKLVNFGENAKANDIQYREEGIFVYGERTEKSHDAEDEGKSRERRVIVDKGECDGETGGNPTMGSSGKELLAIIRLKHQRLIKIEAKSSNGRCVMKRRKQQELDTQFFPGKRLHIDFSERNYDGSEDDDYALLKCPLNTVNEPTTINLGDGENDYLVIGEHLFTDPCDIDGMKLVRHRTLENAWNLVLAGPDLEKFTGKARTITLIGVEKILNEHGDIVLELPDSPTHNLNRKYTDVSRNDMRKWAEAGRTKEIKDNIMTCIDGTGDLSLEKREELCSQGDEDEDENEDENN